MAEMTPEMRAEMRAANTDIATTLRREGLPVTPAAKLLASRIIALLDHCDRLERERDEARDVADHAEKFFHDTASRVEAALSAAHERMREMAEALKQCIPFVQAYEGYVDVGDEDGCRTWQAVSTAYGTAARVLANYRKENADPADRSRTTEGGADG